MKEGVSVCGGISYSDLDFVRVELLLDGRESSQLPELGHEKKKDKIRRRVASVQRGDKRTWLVTHSVHQIHQPAVRLLQDRSTFQWVHAH